MKTEQMMATEHPYLVKIASVCGGRPIIKGTRTPVQAIVEYYRLGLDAYQILTELPYINAQRVFLLTRNLLTELLEKSTQVMWVAPGKNLWRGVCLLESIEMPKLASNLEVEE